MLATIPCCFTQDSAFHGLFEYYLKTYFELRLDQFFPEKGTKGMWDNSTPITKRFIKAIKLLLKAQDSYPTSSSNINSNSNNSSKQSKVVTLFADAEAMQAFFHLLLRHIMVHARTAILPRVDLEMVNDLCCDFKYAKVSKQEPT